VLVFAVLDIAALIVSLFIAVRDDSASA